MDEGGPMDRSGEKNGDAQDLVETLREAVRARDELISIAAHELRNPMTPILLQVERLLDLARRGSPPEQFAALVQELDLLRRLIQSYLKRAGTLLDVSRITSGKLHLDLVPVNLSGVTNEVLDELAPTARLGGCKIATGVEDNVIGLWDQLAIEEIVENLVSNAIKYGAGQPIDVTLARDEVAAWLVVRDRGIGISEEDQARLFGRFERAVAQRRQGGFGIGLWLVRQLVHAMGGDILIKSRSGEGSTFRVMLPLKPGAPTDEERE
jgi:two-component system, OmpR family, sensor kinase